MEEIGAEHEGETEKLRTENDWFSYLSATFQELLSLAT
jgi:hypothetical protein